MVSLWSKQAMKVTKTAAQRPNRGTRRAPQTLHYGRSHKGFRVINEDFEFLFAVNELGSLLFLKLLNSLINVIN